MKKINFILVFAFLGILVVNSAKAQEQEQRCINIFMLANDTTNYNEKTIDIVVSTSKAADIKTIQPLVPATWMLESTLSAKDEYLFIVFKPDKALSAMLNNFTAQDTTTLKAFELPIMAMSDVKLWHTGEIFQNIPPGINYIRSAIVGEHKEGWWVIIMETPKRKMGSCKALFFQSQQKELNRLFFVPNTHEFMLGTMGR